MCDQIIVITHLVIHVSFCPSSLSSTSTLVPNIVHIYIYIYIYIAKMCSVSFNVVETSFVD
jgi:hypothetical protein